MPSLPCSLVASGTGPTDLPLDFLGFFAPALASSLPLSVMWNTFLRLGAPITWADREKTSPSDSSDFSGGWRADLTTPRCSAIPAREIARGTSQDSSRSLPWEDRWTSIANWRRFSIGPR